MTRPMSQLAPVDSWPPTSRNLGARDRGRHARRRRSDSRRRDGRPLRAQHHHRRAGREVAAQGHHAAARRAPDDHGSGSLHRGVHRRRREHGVGARRGAAAPASHDRADQEARRQGRRRAQSVDAGVGDRGGRRRRRLRAGDVGESRLRRTGVHPAQPRRRFARVRALLDRAGNTRADRSGWRHRPHHRRQRRRSRAPNGWWPARRSSAAATPSRPRARSRTRPIARAPDERRRRDAAAARIARSCACATPKPTRWAWSTTRTIWSGSRLAAPTGCARPAGPTARWKPTASSCR